MTPREALKAVPLFGGVLDARSLDVIAAKAEPKVFAKGAVLMRQGDRGDSLLIILEGSVGVSIHQPSGETRVATLGPRDIVGEMSLFTGARRNATVTALKKGSALEVGKAAIASLLVDSRGLLRQFAEMIEQRDAELKSINAEAARWNSVGASRSELVTMMSAHFTG